MVSATGLTGICLGAAVRTCGAPSSEGPAGGLTMATTRSTPPGHTPGLARATGPQRRDPGVHALMGFTGELLGITSVMYPFIVVGQLVLAAAVIVSWARRRHPGGHRDARQDEEGPGRAPTPLRPAGAPLAAEVGGPGRPGSGPPVHDRALPRALATAVAAAGVPRRFAVYWMGWCGAVPLWVLGPRRAVRVLTGGRRPSALDAVLLALPVAGGSGRLVPNRRRIDQPLAAVMVGTPPSTRSGRSCCGVGCSSSASPRTASGAWCGPGPASRCGTWRHRRSCRQRTVVGSWPPGLPWWASALRWPRSAPRGFASQSWLTSRPMRTGSRRRSSASAGEVRPVRFGR